MLAELGHFALVLALLFSILGAAPLFSNHACVGAVAVRATYSVFGLISLAFLALMYSFVQSDFSVTLVVENSHTLKPLLYKISGVWGNHEGSLLLWVLVLSLCAALLALFENRLQPEDKAKALAVLALVAATFLVLSLFTSNPFLRQLPAPLDGKDLNPLLQDPGLAFHPPLLYIGYVGTAVAFAVAVASLLKPAPAVQAWAPVLRTWVLFAWCFLTAGLILGAWWAYYELGWGGWWFWDPVENMALIPWLTGAALLHSVRVAEVRGTLLRWTVLLAILTFGLSMLGTFLVRSGVLTSVHAFASDPLRGLAILGAFAFLIGAALALLAYRWPALGTEKGVAPLSREGMLLLNNIFLSVAAATVLIGTLYPLFIEALQLPAITVGPPYYNATFIPLFLPLLVLAAAGQMLVWGRAQPWYVLRAIIYVPAGAALAVLAGSIYLLSAKQVLIYIGLGLGAYVVAATLCDMRHVWALAQDRGKHVGKWLAHLGLGIMVLGIAGSGLGIEKIIKVTPGSTFLFAGYTTVYHGHAPVPGKNYIAERAELTAAKGEQILRLWPERRYYPVADQITTEAAIHTTWHGDLFATIGVTQPDGGKTLRLRWNPLQVWIWIGAGFMTIGALCAMWLRRRGVHA